VPLFCWRWRQNRRCWSAGHFITIRARTRLPERLPTSARRKRSLALP
jgi:hypothetical protein